MRGMDHQQSGMFSYISAERRVPKDHPLRAIRVMVDAALKESSWRFDAVSASSGRSHRKSFCVRCSSKCFTRCVASGF